MHHLYGGLMFCQNNEDIYFHFNCVNHTLLFIKYIIQTVLKHENKRLSLILLKVDYMFKFNSNVICISNQICFGCFSRSRCRHTAFLYTLANEAHVEQVPVVNKTEGGFYLYPNKLTMTVKYVFQ